MSDPFTHKHQWSELKSNGNSSVIMLICHPCNTVTSLDDLLRNTAAVAAKQAKIDLLASQLWSGELRKDAGERAYAWLMANGPEAVKNKPEQEALLPA